MEVKLVPATHNKKHLPFFGRRHTTRRRHILEFIAAPIIIVLTGFILQYVGILSPVGLSLSSTLGYAALATIVRITIAFIVAFICAVPLALAATHSPTLQKIILPLFDILQSVPILAFFPLLIVIFLNAGLTEGAAVCILFLTMLWSITFALIGGIGLIPRDIVYAAEVFGLHRWQYIKRVVLPAIIPQAVIGSTLAVAQGWNIIIVAEVIRAYLPPDTAVHNLTGLGSMLVGASASGDTGTFVATLATVVIIIAIANFMIWQPLLAYAQKFKFD